MNIKTKSYEEDGKEYKFSATQMKLYINQKKRKQKELGIRVTNNQIMTEIADTLMVSTEAVKNWMYAYNAPVDIEQVKSIAAFFDVDYHAFLELEERNMSVVEKDSYQEYKTKECVREIYLLTLNLIRETRTIWGELEASRDLIDKLYSMVKLIEQKLEDYDLDLPIKFKENIYSFVCRDFFEEYLLDFFMCFEEDSPEDEAHVDLDMNEDLDEDWEDGYEKYREAGKRYLEYGYKQDLNRIFADYKLDQGILKTNMEN